MMLSEIGSFLIGFGLLTNFYAVGALWHGAKQNDTTWQRSGKRALISNSLLLLAALLLLLIVFVTNQFQIDYVAQHSSRDLPFYLKLTAIWAGQEGSLLLWAFLQILFATIESRRGITSKSQLSKWGTIFLAIIAAFFNAITLIFSNPFVASGSVPLDGLGMNPLLRHPGMVFHPPILYLGYVGLAVPFAYALAALITDQVETWVRDVRHWLLIAWLALGVGIILGSRWAYDVLGWGGYWGWDAVENAGLMPWLTATALLHGFSQQRRGKGFRIWNISLAAISFGLVLFGTFTTRSGMIQSVHAFTRSQLGPYLLAMIGFTILGTPIMMFTHKKSLGAPVFPEKIFSREGTTFLTLILLILITISILFGTLMPTLSNGRFSASADWFNRVVGPQLGVLVLLMGVCPLVGRLGRAIKREKWRGIFPIFGLIALPAIIYLAGFNQPISVIGFAIAGFAGGTVIGEILPTAHPSQEKRKISKPSVDLFKGGRKRLGGLLVHFGVVLIAIGVIGTQFYTSERTITLSPGEFSEEGDYKLLYEDLFQETENDLLNTWTTVSVYRGSDYIRTLRPNIAYYFNYDQAMAEPAILSSLGEDLYLVFIQWDDSGAASFNISINPLSSFLWMGALILIIGGVWAWGSALPDVKGVESKNRKWITQISALAGITLIIILAITLWGNPFESLRQSGRPLPGQPAPDFKAQDIDGNDFALDDDQGKAVMLHFWASWCPQCEDELTMIEGVWQDGAYSDIIFVGVAMDDDQQTVSEIASELGLNYRLIADPSGDISHAYGVTAVPETFFISPEGKITSFHIGAMDELTLATELNSLQ